jgi:endonuclease-3 related protein
LTPLKAQSNEESLRAYYSTLFRAWGRQHWWPARTRFEVIVGAYLTQNTAWTNVEGALRHLCAAKALSMRGIRSIPLPQLESLIRSAGYFRQKARRLKIFVDFVDQRYGGSLHRMFAQPTDRLRRELLALDGVGPETADSILLYAGQHPVFVVDAYTRRILDRHGIAAANAKYEELRALFEQALRGVPRTRKTLRTENKELETGFRNVRLAFPHESCQALPDRSGVQRPAWINCRRGQALLSEVEAPLRAVPAAEIPATSKLSQAGGGAV